MKSNDIKKKRRLRRKLSVRKEISGTPDKPRMTVTKSLKHIYAQIIDDEQGKTLAFASTLNKDVAEKVTPKTKKIEKSKLVGAAIAKAAIEKNIKKVAFDRNGYLYHGRIKALADAARENGLEF
ncbi:MAG: 50S ribosomal protein L18 [Ignavibacteria bacterium GWB2_35_12]|nr:MAG: 50S ribosomal protein L18 [Ignavibacteria bacterium GWA2_35_8]OGU39774.1 MAG: 50S ribosomal protein L18 [Ignavibacteria bacterium GWB2_35_12]OGU95545.1 MAG: 50S ribosomal protein L18 [Ignavibacteria bacterium RIFOXYA2_FULL_35_10]OGV21335.1 MAG: 50S ribosomal protein L18 [Ignavibacteria bacterium RIFOXYC2_FULL_35_21]